MIPDGATLMIGGFMAVGTPERLIDELVRQGKRNLTVIANDTAMPGRGIGKLVSAGLISRTDRKPHRPQSRNATADDRRRDGCRSRATGHPHRAHPRRRLRAWRHSHADRRGHRCRGRQAQDRSGRKELSARNRRYAPISRWCMRSSPTTSATSSYALTARNFNPVIAMAADTVIVDGRPYRTSGRHRARPRGDARADRRLPRGQRVEAMDAQTIIAKRIAQELRSGMLVNLGIGIPTLVANHVPEGVSVFFQSENGLIGTGPIPEEGMAHPTLTDAAGQPGERPARRKHVRQCHVVRPHSRRPPRHDRAGRPAG